MVPPQDQAIGAEENYIFPLPIEETSPLNARAPPMLQVSFRMALAGACMDPAISGEKPLHPLPTS